MLKKIKIQFIAFIIRLLKRLDEVLSEFKGSELILLEIGLFLMGAMGLYNLSFDGYMGFSTIQWSLIWSFLECGIAIYLCLLPLIKVKFTGLFKFMLCAVFIPHFLIQLLYHICTYGQVYVMTRKSWDDLTGQEMFIFKLLGIIVFLVYVFYPKKK
jgi:hypothetical protein